MSHNALLCLLVMVQVDQLSDIIIQFIIVVNNFALFYFITGFVFCARAACVGRKRCGNEYGRLIWGLAPKALLWEAIFVVLSSEQPFLVRCRGLAPHPTYFLCLCKESKQRNTPEGGDPLWTPPARPSAGGRNLQTAQIASFAWRWGVL